MEKEKEMTIFDDKPSRINDEKSEKNNLAI